MSMRMTAGPALAGGLLLFLAAGLAAAPQIVTSPNKRLQVTIDLADKIYYAVSFDGRTLVGRSPASMTLGGGVVLGRNPRLLGARPRNVAGTIRPVVPEKRAIIPDAYNELTLTLEGSYGFAVRVYDDGAAYRFFTRMSGEITVAAEEASFLFPENHYVWIPFAKDLMTSFESPYTRLPLDEIGAGRFGFAPVLVDVPGGPKVAITEADLEDYPGMFLTGNDRGLPMLSGKFAPFPLEEKLRPGSDRRLEVTKAAPHIAAVKGSREFPWRVLIVAETDARLLENDLVYRLGPDLRIADPSWIRPGKVAWDWWNALNLRGVPFRAGVNTETYKHYVDFAAAHGIEYVILDEGWSAPADLLHVNPDLDMPALLAHAAERKVGLILWCVWVTLDRQMDQVLDLFAAWGIKGIKVDFMDRDDQKAVNFYTRTAEAAARRRLLVDFHGAFKPTGLRRAYPNILTREGVLGLENAKWSRDITPEHDLLIPFIRMAAGPMDYTPGAMVNAQPRRFQPVFERPMSQGTRCHQLAMFVAYESPLQMLCDSPSNYAEEPEAMAFLSAVPTVWDETIALDAAVGDYLVVARRRGGEWFAAAMTDEAARTVEIGLAFLGQGTWTADIYADGVNADRHAEDFRREARQVTAADRLKIDLAPGGGWAARFRRQ